MIPWKYSERRNGNILFEKQWGKYAYRNGMKWPYFLGRNSTNMAKAYSWQPEMGNFWLFSNAAGSDGTNSEKLVVDAATKLKSRASKQLTTHRVGHTRPHKTSTSQLGFLALHNCKLLQQLQGHLAPPLPLPGLPLPPRFSPGSLHHSSAPAMDHIPKTLCLERPTINN